MTNKTQPGLESTPTLFLRTAPVATVAPIPITRAIAQKVLETMDQGLSLGKGEPIPGRMCVEAAVCYALGLPHSDDPGCVAQSLRKLKMRLNDSNWSSRPARARGLRRLGLAQLGSLGVLDELQFVGRVVELVITKQLPAVLRAAASIHTNSAHQAALNTTADRCESDPTAESCLAALYAAEAANPYDGFLSARAINAVSTCASFARNAADPRKPGLGFQACQAADAAVSAAEGLAVVAGASSGLNYAEALLAFDESLGKFAEDVVQVLVELKAPGCEWLDLTQAA